MAAGILFVMDALFLAVNIDGQLAQIVLFHSIFHYIITEITESVHINHDDKIMLGSMPGLQGLMNWGFLEEKIVDVVFYRHGHDKRWFVLIRGMKHLFSSKFSTEQYISAKPQDLQRHPRMKYSKMLNKSYRRLIQ